MGTRFSRSGSSQSLLPGRRRWSRQRGAESPPDTDSLDGLDRREDIAQFPYVEFTGRDSITCPSCQGTGRIPSAQVNELVALIPYSDQRLRPQRTKLYVVLSVVLCLLASGLGAFFLFPRSVIVVSDGVRSVVVHFDPTEQTVLMKLTSTLNFSNPNFFSVLVESLSCQVLYMKTVVGTSQMDNVTTILPLSETQDVSEELLHGENVPKQFGVLPLHRLWSQQHIPPQEQAALGPPPTPFGSSCLRELLTGNGGHKEPTDVTAPQLRSLCLQHGRSLRRAEHPRTMPKSIGAYLKFAYGLTAPVVRQLNLRTLYYFGWGPSCL